METSALPALLTSSSSTYLFLNVRALLAGMATSLGFVAGALLVSGRVCPRIGAALAEAAALCGKDE